MAVSSGMTFSDGTAESKVTLQMAKILKEKLLAAGYDVLMIRESDDVQLDNIARTVIANNRADCHIALHWDSTTSNKGAFYMRRAQCGVVPRHGAGGLALAGAPPAGRGACVGAARGPA